MREQSLGKLISVHGTSSVYLQRAAIVAFTSFLFFLGMLIAFYIRQHFGYFLLSTAFLVVLVFTVIGWWMQKRNVVQIYERGITYRSFTADWTEIEKVASCSGKGITIVKKNDESVGIVRSIGGLDEIESWLRSRMTESSLPHRSEPLA